MEIMFNGKKIFKQYYDNGNIYSLVIMEGEHFIDKRFHENGALKIFNEQKNGDTVVYQVFYEDGSLEASHNEVCNIAWDESGKVTYFFDKSNGITYQMSEMVVRGVGMATRKMKQEEFDFIQDTFGI